MANYNAAFISAEDVVVLKIIKYKHGERIIFQDPESFESTNYNACLNACGGAVAFCKMAGLMPQMNAQERVAPQNAEVCQLLIGVKTIIPKDSYLECNEQQAQKALDIYVLMRGDAPEFTFMGWTTKAQLFSQENRVNYADIRPGGRGFGYRMHFSRLTESLALTDLVTQKGTRKDDTSTNARG